MSQQQDYLFRKLLRGDITPEELEILVSWLGTKELDPQAEELIASQLKKEIKKGDISPEIQLALEAKLPEILYGSKRTVAFNRPWSRYAAAAIIILSIGTFLFLTQQKSDPRPLAQTKPAQLKNDVDPGSAGAVLILANGQQLVLDSMSNGFVAAQTGSNISLENGKLTYDQQSSTPTAIEYNTVTTPRGRQFQLTLADGTQVWLNAGSSLRFPTVFTGNERRVEASGEIYFEVAKNKAMPFKVNVNNESEIEVLGTHFNVNSYSNEAAINTTLLEGSVKISHNQQNTIIKPGQQAQVSHQNNSPIKVVTNVNVAKVMAWKNGVFDFENATLEEVMRQLERWYDVDVVYEKGIPKLEFFGRMGRDLTLSNVLRGLEMSKVHFRVEGKRLVVLP